MIEYCKAVLIDEITKAGKDGRLVKEDYLLARGREVLDTIEDLPPDAAETLVDELPGLADEDGIRSVTGKKGIYFYSSEHIADNYAAMKVKIDEEDFLALVAQQVRHESKIYPRPTIVDQFAAHPYSIGREELAFILETIERDPEFSDIRKISASNGDLYLYSKNFLDDGIAAYQAEWESVDSVENQ